MINQDPIEEIKALVVKGEIDQPIQKLSEFLNRDFFHDEALFMLGACFMAKGLNGLAAVVTHSAVAAREEKGQNYPEALMNLGGCYKSEHRYQVAERIWKRALLQETLPRERAKILTNLSGLYIGEGCPEKAIEWCDRALSEDPRNHGAAANRGIACLEAGRWREGWDGWSHTYQTGDRQRRRYGRLPEWGGEGGQTVIVYGDQGIGDEIFYAGCLADMRERCSKVILDCHPRIDKLFARSFPDFTVHGTRKHLTGVDWVEDSGAEAAVCISDLPGFFRNEASEWCGKPFLRASDGRERSGTGSVERSVFANRKGSPLRIGLAWTGGSKRTHTHLRSMPITAFEPVVRARPEAQWFSLEYKPDAARDVCELEEKTGIRVSHFPGWVECYDYDRTASFVASLDLLIVVTTAVHDLGGALGIPTWTLVPKRTGWRFQVSGETLPWYDSARLFRQEKDGDWAGLMERVAAELAGFKC